jgi:2',3'-cyclic-nucleotide 2'-phosphodiesterase (5'-nucleotidase family)
VPSLPKTSLFFNELYLEVNEKIPPLKARDPRTILLDAGDFQHGTTIAREWLMTAPAASYIR